MAEYLTNTTDLTKVASAIREKGGTSDPLVYPDGFVTAIQAIETGGGTADVVEWNNVLDKPTTIAGYGITDANIENGTITLGNQTITPVTSVNGGTGAVMIREVPAVTTADNGKFMRVVNGTWTAVVITNASGGKF